MGLREKLVTGQKKIGVWGLGYIGFSTISYFAKAGVPGIGTDVNPERVEAINEGEVTIPNFMYWLGFDVKYLAKDRIMTATSDWKKLIDKDIAVHLITIPTEKDGKPYHDILKEVINNLSNLKSIEMEEPPLVIVESTLTPSAADEIVIPLFRKNGLEVGKDILFGIAPRRDWFTEPDKTLKTLPRVVGGTDLRTSKLMEEVLGIICDKIVIATDHRHAAIVKSVENAYRQLDITFANQLSLAYPDMNMTEVLRMAGTKWNVGTYHPSFGTGGYCIPLAPQYVLEGASRPEELTLLRESLKSDFSQPEKVVSSLIKRGSKKVGILGIAYTGNIKVHILSPGVAIAKSLKAKGIEVKVNDPFYSKDEIEEITGCGHMKFPEGLSDVDTVLIAASHMQYVYTCKKKLVNNLRNVRLIIDNMGVWRNLKFPGHIRYFEAGNANWI